MLLLLLPAWLIHPGQFSWREWLLLRLVYCEATLARYVEHICIANFAVQPRAIFHIFVTNLVSLSEGCRSLQIIDAHDADTASFLCSGWCRFNYHHASQFVVSRYPECQLHFGDFGRVLFITSIALMWWLRVFRLPPSLRLFSCDSTATSTGSDGSSGWELVLALSRAFIGWINLKRSCPSLSWRNVTGPLKIASIACFSKGFL